MIIYDIVFINQVLWRCKNRKRAPGHAHLIRLAVRLSECSAGKGGPNAPPRAERAAAGRNLPKPAETGGKIKTKRRGTRAGAPSLLIQCRIQKLKKLFTSPQKGLVKTRQKLPRCEPRPPQSTNLNRFRPTSGEYSRSTWPSMRCRMNSPVRLTMARFTWPPWQMPCITLATTMCRCR